MSKKLLILLGAATLGLAACGTTAPGAPKEIVTVQFDPNDYQQADLDRSAAAMCEAKSYRVAFPYAAQPTMRAGAWSYRTYGCY